MLRLAEEELPLLRLTEDELLPELLLVFWLLEEGAAEERLAEAELLLTADPLLRLVDEEELTEVEEFLDAELLLDPDERLWANMSEGTATMASAISAVTAKLKNFFISFKF